MNELKHWLDEASDADDFERAVLRSGTLENPPPVVEREVWAKVRVAVVLAPLGAALPSHATALKTATGGVKTLAVWLGVGKGFVVGLALYGAVTGVNAISERYSAAQRSNATRRSPVATAPSASHTARPVSALPLTDVTEPSTALTVPSAEPEARDAPLAARSAQEHALVAPMPEVSSVAAFADPPSNAGPVDDQRRSQLQAEARALRDARTQLRAGRLSNAFATLEASRLQFATPELYQEREALTIELLYRTGQMDAAARRAQAFLERFPESPDAEQVKQFTGRR